MFVSVELTVPSAAIATLVPAVKAATTLVVSVTSAEASTPSNLVFNALVKSLADNALPVTLSTLVLKSTVAQVALVPSVFKNLFA